MKANELPVYHQGLLDCCIHSILNSTADVEIGSTLPCKFMHRHEPRAQMMLVVVEGNAAPAWKDSDLKGKCTHCHGDGFDMGLHGPVVCYPCKGTGEASKEVENFPPKCFSSFDEAKRVLDL